MKENSKNIEQAVLAGLASVFQSHGFGGATLTLFTQATGLKRPSLYHRFPDGKLAMALAVLEFAKQQLIGQVLAPLKETGDPRKRIQEAAKNMAQFYVGGNDTCLMDALSVGAKGSDRETIDRAVADMFTDFIGAFAEVAAELGADPSDAFRRGEDAVARLEGSLVVARGTGSTAAFTRTLNDLPDLLTAKHQ